MEAAYQFPRSSPEAEGIASGAIKDFVVEVEKASLELHSLMLLRHGRVLAEGWWKPYLPDDPHILFSLSKSFTSTAVGLAIAEGKLRLEDPILSFFPHAQPLHVSDNLAAMQVRHLLTMRSGHATDTMEAFTGGSDSNWVQAFLAQPVEHKPDTFFVYNTGATYMLSAIVQQVTGLTLREYLQPRLFKPLGIAYPSWESSPQGINVGGFGLSITTDEIARFGQLYLQKGLWREKTILPSGWVAEATTPIANGSQTAIDWEQGYGYQFWGCRYGAYRGDGAFGQFCLVMPEQEVVLAITAGLQQEMQQVLDLVWKHLLPAMKPTALPANPTAQQELAQKLARLELPLVMGQPTIAKASQVSGQRFLVDANHQKIKAISFDFDQDGCVLTVEDERGSHKVECGNGAWRLGTTTLNRGERRVGACGSWIAEDTYRIQLHYRTSVLPEPPSMTSAYLPFGVTITCRFARNKVIVEQEINQALVSTGPTKLEGRLA